MVVGTDSSYSSRQCGWELRVRPRPALWPRSCRRLHLLAGSVNIRVVINTCLPLHQSTQGDMLYDHSLPKHLRLHHDQPPLPS